MKPSRTLRHTKPTSSSPRRSVKRNNIATAYDPLENRQLLAVITVDTVFDQADGAMNGQISLREAIIAANTNAPYGDAPAGDFSGDVIQFSPALNGATITLVGGEFSITDDLVIRGGTNNVTIDAGENSRIFNINTDQNVSLVRLTMTNGTALEGGAVLTQGGGTVRLYQSHFALNTATHIASGGGAIYNVNSRIFADQSLFGANLAYGEGGAIFSANGTIHLSDATFTGNMGAKGGGAMLAVEGNYYLSEVFFVGNYSGDDLLETQGTNTGTILGASVTRANVDFEGGAISFAGPSAISVMIGTTFDDNTALGNGGAIAMEPGNRLFVYNISTFSNNMALGGAVGVNGGGAIFSRDAIVRVSSSSFSDNMVHVGNGGAVLTIGGQLSLFNSIVTNNATTRNGGGLYADGTNVTLNATQLLSNMAGTLPTGVTNNDLANQTPSGGGLFLGSSAGTRATIGNSSFQFNNAKHSGGAISSSAESTRVIGTFIGGNVAEGNVSALQSSGGGAIFHAGNALRIYNSTLQNNKALSQQSFGGAVFTTRGILELNNSTLSLNRTDGSGGGLAIVGGSATVFRSNIGLANSGMGNSAGPLPASPELLGGLGGGIFFSSSNQTLTVIGGTIGANLASRSGGGMWLAPSTKLVLRSAAPTAGSITHEASVRGNTALANDGGGIYSDGAELEIRDALFAGNTSRNGAGLYLNNGSVRLTNSNVGGNAARRVGGGIVQRNVVASLFGSTVSGNTAPLNPDIANL